MSRFRVESLSCPGCNAPVGYAGPCGYCGREQFIVPMESEDENLRDIRFENGFFALVTRLGKHVGIDVGIGVPEAKEFTFAVFAKKELGDDLSWREVGTMKSGINNSTQLVYSFYAMSPRGNDVDFSTLLEVRPVTMLGMGRKYQTKGMMCNLLNGSLSAYDLDNNTRSPLWLMAVKMLVNIDSSVGDKLVEVARVEEKMLGINRSVVSESVFENPDTVRWLS